MRRSFRPEVASVVAIVLAVLAMVLGYGATTGHRLTFAFLLAGLALAGCFAVPVRLLPSVALVLALILPFEVTKWPVALLPMAAWLVRAPRLKRFSRSTQFAAIALAGWIVISEIFATFHSRSGDVWVLSAFIGLIAPPILGPKLDKDLLKRTFLGLASILGPFAVIETFVLKSNPIYGHLYASGGDPIIQGTTYRATTLLGHPLINGVFFATASVLAVNEAMARGASRWSLIRVLLVVSGLGASLSRGSSAAAAIGIALCVLLRPSRATTGLRRFAVLVVLLLAGAAFATALINRSSSVQGQKSLIVRSNLLHDTEHVLKGHALIGVGPGIVQQYRVKYGFLDPVGVIEAADTSLESTYAELVVGIGIPGLALFVLMIGGGVFASLRAGLIGEGCTLLTFAVSLGTFKTEGHVQLLIVAGLLLALALPGQVTEDDDALPNQRRDSEGSPSPAVDGSGRMPAMPIRV